MPQLCVFRRFGQLKREQRSLPARERAALRNIPLAGERIAVARALVQAVNAVLRQDTPPGGRVVEIQHRVLRRQADLHPRLSRLVDGERVVRLQLRRVLVAHADRNSLRLRIRVQRNVYALRRDRITVDCQRVAACVLLHCQRQRLRRGGHGDGVVRHAARKARAAVKRHGIAAARNAQVFQAERAHHVHRVICIVLHVADRLAHAHRQSVAAAAAGEQGVWQPLAVFRRGIVFRYDDHKLRLCALCHGIVAHRAGIRAVRLPDGDAAVRVRHGDGIAVYGRGKFPIQRQRDAFVRVHACAEAEARQPVRRLHGDRVLMDLTAACIYGKSRRGMVDLVLRRRVGVIPHRERKRVISAAARARVFLALRVRDGHRHAASRFEEDRSHLRVRRAARQAQRQQQRGKYAAKTKFFQ